MIGLGLSPSEVAARRLGPGTVRVALGTFFKTGDTAYVSNPQAGQGLAQGGTFYLVNKTGGPINRFRIGWAYAKPSNGSLNAVREVLVTSGGAGYTSATATVSGGSGSGAMLECIVVSGAVAAILIKATGNGWTIGEVPTISIAGDGTGAAAIVARMDGAGEVAYRYDATGSGGIEYPLGTTTPLTFGGSASVAVLHGATTESDELTLPIDVPDGAVYGIKAVESIAVAPTFSITKSGNAISSMGLTNKGSGLWETQYAITFTSGGGSGAAATAYTYQGQIWKVEVTAGGSYTGTPTPTIQLANNRPVTTIYGDRNTAGAAQTTPNGIVSGPAYATADAVGSARSSILLLDSIANGFSGGDGLGDEAKNYGWPARIAGRVGGAVKLTLPGDYLSSFNLRHAVRSVVAAKARATSVICNGGTNDIARGDPLAVVQASAIAAWTELATLAPVHQGTLPPQTTSPDAFTSVGGQSPKANFGPGSVAEAFNAWLRDGAPLSGGVAAPAGASGSSIRRAGQPGHPVHRIADVAAQVEAAPGLWLPMVWGASGQFSVSGAPTGDGTHPRDLYHAMIVGRLGAVSSIPGAGYASAPTPVLSNLGIPRLNPVFASGALSGISIEDDGGVDYDFLPPLTVLAINGAGSGASARVTLTNRRITGATVTAAGSGYTNGAIVAVSGAHPPKLRCVLNGDGTVTTVMDWPGSGLTQVPTITLTGGGGTGAGATATLMRAIDPASL